MLNFSGQTKRRNVNLGTRAARSKQDLLSQASKEREKRALARRDDESALLIQKSIRRHLSNRTLFKFLITDLNSSKAVKLTTAYGQSLFPFLEDHELVEILQKVINKGQTALNESLCRMVRALGTRSSTEDLFMAVWAAFNINCSTGTEFVSAIVDLVTSAPYAIPEKALDGLVQLIEDFGIPQDSRVVSLLGIPRKDVQKAENLQYFLLALGLKCSLEKIPINWATPYLIENLSCLFINLPVERRENYCHYIVNCLPLVDEGALKDATYFKELYTRDFVDMIMLSELEKVFSMLSTFISRAPTVDCKNTVLVGLVARPQFMVQAHKAIFISSGSSIIPRTGALLLVEMLNIYLSVASDFEIMHNTESYPLNYLLEMTDYLKLVCFKSLWDLEEESHALPDTFLKTLKKIHVRDSRLNFSPRSMDSDYWSVTDVNFVSINITKYIEDYESFYRSRVDDLEIRDEDVDGMQLFEIKRELRYEFLIEVQKSFGNRATTRQFRKLNVLSQAPFFIPFQQRVEWLYFLISLDHKRLNIDGNDISSMFAPWHANSPSSKQTATISREHLLEDAFNAYNPIGENFKSKLSVTFVSEFGPEAGIDGGGITKEFLTSVSDQGFKDEKYHLFEENEHHEIYPSASIHSSKHLKYLWFLGKVLGKCLYDHVLIDVTFADFFLKKLLNVNQMNSSFDDLASFDASLYTNLARLIKMNSSELQALGLRFEITDNESLQTVDLIPSGADTAVTKTNVLQYLLAVADYKLNRKLRLGTRSFTGGLYTIVPPHWLEMFSSIELQMLISGGGKDIDLTDLHKHTEYGDYSEQDQTIKDFWSILADFDSQDRLKFVKFVTSVPRAPLQGFRALNPLFGIRNAGSDVTRLPTASTCVNLLKLPDYQNRELLKTKLLYAITAEARFDLS
ncbi:LADA_0C01992g1_1 [Lachancea dasiensis]|uniref:HECT-type E3 ubiquitin transferase n=1 Tax=Lachancea dasiensis TaxID=1072105 RepID=A0A1G4IXX6_9SACH|nr:LADA_0C01992g1_1 [Lachancea dasiensis]